MPRGAKTAKSCTVETCTLESGQIPTVSIFQLRRIKGWWPFLRTDESNPNEKEVTVSTHSESLSQIHLKKCRKYPKTPIFRGK